MTSNYSFAILFTHYSEIKVKIIMKFSIINGYLVIGLVNKFQRMIRAT